MKEAGDSLCPFCSPAKDRIAFEGSLTRGLWDAYPASPGHLLIVPRRHVPTWFEATAKERAELMLGIDRARELLATRYCPDGFNIGINVGCAAGQTVFHLHVHIIPRYSGDVPDPRGGVRHIIPGRGNYLVSVASPKTLKPFITLGPEQSALSSLLISGGEEDPFLPYLIAEFALATQAHIAVGFILPSGVNRIIGHMRDFLSRGGQLNLLTGDYLDVTDPDALVRLQDLGGDRTLRVFDTRRYSSPTSKGPVTPPSFHVKAYLFKRRDGTGVAFIGSSNLSESALMTGIEWNYRTVSSSEGSAFDGVCRAFEQLFHHAATTELTADWIASYRSRRRSPDKGSIHEPIEVAVEPRDLPAPHAIQQHALEALRHTRDIGNTAGLVVLATGLGKTWLSAFDADSPEYRRVLFVAHREEILTQSRDTFRRIRPEARLGFYMGRDRDLNADILFASVQTLGRLVHLERFPRDSFDYIIIDEFHHAAASTYRRLINYFRPKFLLGLTATPERTDGGDLLSLCEENLVFRCDLVEGVRQNLLCRFSYFGVPDEVNYQEIPWRSSRFDEEELTKHVATESRAQNAYENLKRLGGLRAMAFCVSQKHADFMAEFFRQKDLRAVAVHSGPTSAPRTWALEELANGGIDVICAVDIFNEGLDLPLLDTILMLRPTESRILWLQQFGRGLRKTDDEKKLTVIDYIGNHRTFLLKPLTLFNLPTGSQGIMNLLEQARTGPIEIAPGCFVTYEMAAIDILRGLARVGANRLDALKRYYEDFTELHGTRPTAAEAFHEGYNPRAVRQQTGSWLGFIRSVGGLTPDQALAQQRHAPFLAELEITPMTKSYKMLVLQAMLNEDQFPGEIAIDTLGEAVMALASRNQHLRDDLGPRIDTTAGLKQHLEQNPIEAWAGGRGTGGTPYFAYEAGIFRTTFPVDSSERGALQELTREIADWRLAEYLDRLNRNNDEDETSYICKVSHSGGRPILFLPDRATNPGLPEGPTEVDIEGTSYEANFVKVAVNVLRLHGETDNRMPQVLRGWFGADAGLPGTRHHVALECREGGWHMRAVGRAKNDL